jgi:hypothetical protein
VYAVVCGYPAVWQCGTMWHCVAVCGSAGSVAVRQCKRQCAAVRQCRSVRQCAAVRHSAAVRQGAAVCCSVRQ